MKKILFILFTVSMIFHSINAQNISRLEISLMPLSMLQLSQPHLRGGLRVYPLKNISIGADFGYGNDFLYYMKDNSFNYSYYSIRPEIDYSIIRTDEHNFYIGLEYFYYKKQNSLTAGSFFTKDFYHMQFTQADYTKIKEGLHLKTGLTIYTKHGLLLDFYTGIGYRRKFAEYTNVIDGVFREEQCPLCIIERLGFVQGTNLSLGFKIGYAF